MLLSVSYPDFSDPTRLNLLGHAAITAADVLRLTPASTVSVDLATTARFGHGAGLGAVYCLDHSRDLLFGSDGLLYVASGQSHEVLRYDGISGDFLDVFVGAGAGGLNRPNGLVFDAQGDLLVGSAATDEALRFDGSSGAFLDACVPGGAGDLLSPPAFSPANQKSGESPIHTRRAA